MILFLFLSLASVAYGQFGMPGGLTPQSESDPKWVEKLQNLSRSQNLFDSNAQIEVMHIATQVVAGIKTYYTLKVNGHICNVVLFDQAWTDTHEIVSNTCPKSKRQLAGGWHKGNPNDPAVTAAVTFVLDAVNAMSNDLFRLVQNGDVKVEQQVVAGTNFHLTFMVGDSTCRNIEHNKGLDASHCPLKATNSLMQRVQATVWDQPWRTPRYIITDGPTITGNGGRINLGGGTINQVGGSSPEKPELIGKDDGHDCAGLFANFVKKYRKLYVTPDEKRMRYKTFCSNMRLVKKIQEAEMGTAIYGATEFADLTESEFRHYVGYRWDQTANDWMKKARIPRGPIPASFDWRDHNAVTPVKNQGSCGSCWAFSTTGNIEGQWALKKNKLLSLSEQELVDCDKLDDGCEGGLPSNAYKEIERLGGLETEAEYAYKGKDEKCAFIKSGVRAYINSSVSISSNETDMAAWLAENGPISIGINAFVMQFYMGGISHPWRIFCNPKNLDHGVLIVGYGVEGSTPYWIIKNSWGESWGEKGYYRAYRGDGVCGLNTMCTSAVVD